MPFLSAAIYRVEGPFSRIVLRTFSAPRFILQGQVDHLRIARSKSRLAKIPFRWHSVEQRSTASTFPVATLAWERVSFDLVASDNAGSAAGTTKHERSRRILVPFFVLGLRLSSVFRRRSVNRDVNPPLSVNFEMRLQCAQIMPRPPRPSRSQQ